MCVLRSSQAPCHRFRMDRCHRMRWSRRLEHYACVYPTNNGRRCCRAAAAPWRQPLPDGRRHCRSPAITGYRERSEAAPNWTWTQLVIQGTVGYEPTCLGDNLTMLSQVYVSQRGHGARTATHLAMCPAIACPRISVLLVNCQGSRLLRGQAATTKIYV